MITLNVKGAMIENSPKEIVEHNYVRIKISFKFYIIGVQIDTSYVLNILITCSVMWIDRLNAKW